MTISDDELRAMLRARAARADARGLREATLATARSTPQLERLARPWRTWSLVRLLGGLAGAAAIILAVAVGAAALRPQSSGSPGPVGSVAPPPPTNSPAPTDVTLTPPPYVADTCPVTPFTVLVGGTDPMIVVSGVRWIWGGIPWMARVGQKVVLHGADGLLLGTADTIRAERLPIGKDAPPISVLYANSYNSGVFGIGLPEPGCWLLTVIGPTARSSVVVEAGPAPAHPADPAAQAVPTATAPVKPVTQCPASPGGLAPFGQTIRLLDSLDPGGVVWWTPAQDWLIGKEDKIVLGGAIGAPAAFERVVATRVLAGPKGEAFVTDPPTIVTPTPGGGDLSMGITLPSAGCWAFTFIDPTTSSTVVVDVKAAVP